MGRKHEQAQLISELGMLCGPLLKIAENKEVYEKDERVRAVARFFDEKDKFMRSFSLFASSESGHKYFPQEVQLTIATNKVQTLAIKSPDDEDAFFIALQKFHPEVLNIILSIPVTTESTIHQAQTPFSTYCFVKDLCSTAKKEIVWLDRYFDFKVFHRFFAEVNPNVLITLVTYPETKLTSARDKDRYTTFMDISRLFAQERGTKGYRLLVHEKFHDRLLRCDNAMFALGGSIKDLDQGITFTITKLDVTSENKKECDYPVQNGEEIYGTNHSIHR